VSVQFGLRTIVLSSSSEDGQVRNSREPQFDADNILNLCVTKSSGKNGENIRIVTDRIIAAKWRDAERGYPIFVEMQGEFCRFKDVTGDKV